VALLVNYMQPAVGDLSEIDIPASTLRMLAQALAGPGNDGVFAPSSAVVTHRAAGANFSVDIAPFAAIVAGNDISDQGSYLITNTATYNLATPVAPGSGTRTHRLVGQVRDHRCNGSWAAGTYDWIPLIVQDSGGGLPALPASAVDLAHITIAAGQANVADTNIVNSYPLLKTLVTATTTLDLGPWQQYQASTGSWNSTGSWVPYSAGNWPHVAFTVPPSGKVYVTISGGVQPAANAACCIGFGVGGTDSVSPTFGRCISAGNGTTIRASVRCLVPGLTPGAADEAIAFWYQNAGGCSDTNDGHLIVEAVQ
jgi:hypothetical protein